MTEQPPIQTTPVGALRFNTDTSKLEYFDGNQFVNISTTSPEAETGGTRGLFQLGYTTQYVTDMDFANISTTGNAQDFGFMTTRRGNGSFCFGSRTRDIRGNGYEVPANTSTNVMDFFTIASTGDGTDIGDAVKISNISLPENVQPSITDRDFVIATLVPPTVEAEPEEKKEEAETPDGEEKKEESKEDSKSEKKEGDSKPESKKTESPENKPK